MDQEVDVDEKEEEIAFQKRLLAIKSKARPITEEENQRMEDRDLMVLKQHRESISKQSSNDPVVSTGAE